MVHLTHAPVYECIFFEGTLNKEKMAIALSTLPTANTLVAIVIVSHVEVDIFISVFESHQ